MSTDLFDTTWIILVAIIVGSILARILPGFVVTTPKVGAKSKLHKKSVIRKSRIAWIAGIALIVSAATYTYLQFSFPEDIIPIQLLLWMLPFGITLGVLPFCFIDAKHRTLTACLLLPALIVAALATNNYYHYYPTVSAFFEETTSHKTADQIPQGTAAHKTALEEYYAPLPDQPQKGTLSTVTIPASGHYTPRSAYVYVPPALAKNSSLTLPVVVLLGGFPGSPSDWVNAGAQSILDDFAAKHKGLAPIVVIPDITSNKNVDTECINSRLGDVETYLVKDIPAYMKAHYQVASDPSSWAIIGYSEGGTCSTMIAIRNPNVYHLYGNITGDSAPSLNTPEQTLSILYGGDQTAALAHDPTHLLATTHNLEYAHMHAWYYLANHDSPVVRGRLQVQARTAKAAGVDVTFQEVNGHHGFEVWKAGFIGSLPWLMRIDTIIN